MTLNVAISGIALFSYHLDKTAEFYNALGLHLQKSIHGWGPKYSYLDIIEKDGQRVFFEIHEASLEKVNFVNLKFEVDNVGETLQKLITKSALVERPKNKKFRHLTTIAVVQDPDGRSVQLNQRKK